MVIVILLLIGCKKPGGESTDVTGDTKGKKQNSGFNPFKKKDASSDAKMFKSTDNVETIFAVNTTKAVKGEINDYIELNGDVQAKTKVDVYPDVMGKLTGIYVKVGQYVNKDDVVAEVDPSKAGMNYSLSPVKAPISGTVVEVPRRVGATVTQQIPLIKIGVLNQIEIVSFISEKFISKIKYGLPVLLKFEAYPDITFKGYVSELSPVVDPQSRMMEISISLNERDSRIKSGMFAKLKIITENKNSIVKIPVEALVKRYGENFVFVTKENGLKVEKRKVTLGIQIDNKVEIASGLKADEEIVIRGQTLLDDNTKIKIIETISPISSKDSIDF